jgi:hypothetical protein
MQWDHKTRRRQRGGVKFAAAKSGVSRKFPSGAKPVGVVSKSVYRKTLGKTLGKKSKSAYPKSRGFKVIKVKQFFRGYTLDKSADGLSKLLHIYTHASSISDDNRDNIFEFLLILNERIREVANIQMDKLTVYFNTGSDKQTLEKILVKSDANVDNIEEKIKECINFLRILSKKIKLLKGGEYTAEVKDLVVAFNSAISKSVLDAKELVLLKMGENDKPANNDMGPLINAFGGQKLVGDEGMGVQNDDLGLDVLVKALGELAFKAK